MILTTVKETTSPYTFTGFPAPILAALIPSLGLGKLFSNNQYVTIALPPDSYPRVHTHLGVSSRRPSFGYELRATGSNKNAAKYCGMKEKSATSSSPGHRGRARWSRRGVAVPHRI